MSEGYHRRTMSSDFLTKVTGERRADAEARAEAGALADAEAAIADAPPVRDFRAALSAPGLRLVAEVKRASPSAGAIAEGADPVGTARAYQSGGAAAVSVLTEPTYFKGSLDDLRAVRAAVDLPVLRKDFICHDLMVAEARAAGADACLLIVAALDDMELAALVARVRDLGMTALVEVHDAEEVARAVAAGAEVIGINTRNLQTLTVDLATVEQVRPTIPDGICVVGESGIGGREDAARMAAAGCDAVLVGETLMRADDPARAVEELLGSAPPR